MSVVAGVRRLVLAVGDELVGVHGMVTHWGD